MRTSVNLTEALANQYTPARRTRDGAPKGFEPGVKYESNGMQVITTPPMAHLSTEDEWRTAVESLGVSVPDGWRLRLVEARYDPAAWHRDKEGEDAVTRPVWRYRFAVEPDLVASSNVDELVRLTANAKPPKQPKRAGVAASQVVVWSDWQLFKAAGDGIDGTVRRIRDSWQATLDLAKEWRRNGYQVDDLVIVGNGDILEGCAIFPHQMMEITGDLRDQRNAARRLIVEGIRHLAPHYQSMRVTAVGGNHGENRIDGKRINRHDNSDAEVFESAADVLAENPEAFGHVSFQIPRDELAATIDVQGWVLGHTHGHIAGRGGASPEAKLRQWFDRQAGAKAPAGDSHLLLTSHYHHHRVADWGANNTDRTGCVWVQSPAMDGGSPHFSEMFGGEAPPGVTSILVTAGNRAEQIRNIPL